MKKQGSKVFMIAFAMVMSVLLSACSNYSEGERIGVITKVSEKGMLWKSTEVEMKVAPGIANDAAMVGQYETISFSVDNDSTYVCITPIEDIKTYAKLGIPVTIHYMESKFLNWFNNRGDTNRFIMSVEPVEDDYSFQIEEAKKQIRDEIIQDAINSIPTKYKDTTEIKTVAPAKQ